MPKHVDYRKWPALWAHAKTIVDPLHWTITCDNCGANRIPVASAGPDQSVQVGATVTVDGSGSTDADGQQLTQQWSFVSRPATSGATLSDVAAVRPTFTVDKAGSYVVQLVVNDGAQDSAADSVTITTQNSAPVAHAGNDQVVDVGDVVLFDGTGSSDVDGNPLTYAWNLLTGRLEALRY